MCGVFISCQEFTSSEPILHTKVHQLLTKNAIIAYLFSLGLDDQDARDWDDHEV